MEEKDISIATVSVESKEKVEERIISRRSFIGASGKVVALGMLMHFTMIGNASASILSAQASCSADIPGCVPNYICIDVACSPPSSDVGCPTPYCYNSPADAPCIPALDIFCPLLDFCIRQDSGNE